MSYSHSDEDLAQLFEIYESIFKDLRMALDQENLKDKLNCDILKPLFSVRQKHYIENEVETV